MALLVFMLHEIRQGYENVQNTLRLQNAQGRYLNRYYQLLATQTFGRVLRVLSRSRSKSDD